MKLDTLGQRHEFICDLIQKAFEFEESLIHGEENGNDWGGAMSTVENLDIIEEMIRAEGIFLDVFDKMGEVRTTNRDEKESFMGIFYFDGLNVFNQEMLMPRLKHAKENLDSWGFRTEEGKEFYEEFSAKVNALIKKYDGLYDV